MEHFPGSGNQSKTSLTIDDSSASRRTLGKASESNFGLPHNPKVFVEEVGEREFKNKEGPGVAIYRYEQCLDE